MYKWVGKPEYQQGKAPITWLGIQTFGIMAFCLEVEIQIGFPTVQCSE